MSGQPKLTFYFRSGCSLCEDMQHELMLAQPRYGFELREVDVDRSPELVARYGHKVPVLTAGEGEEICHYFLDHNALQGYFSGG